MAAVSQFVLDRLSEVEAAAEDVLTTKQQIVDLDNRRNKTREALNFLKQGPANSEKIKVWFGNVFIKFPKSNAREMIEKDQQQLEQQINTLRMELKAKVNHLNELQGKPEMRGYSLSPLSSEELRVVNSLLKR